MIVPKDDAVCWMYIGKHVSSELPDVARTGDQCATVIDRCFPIQPLSSNTFTGMKRWGQRMISSKHGCDENVGVAGIILSQKALLNVLPMTCSKAAGLKA